MIVYDLSSNCNNSNTFKHLIKAERAQTKSGNDAIRYRRISHLLWNSKWRTYFLPDKELCFLLRLHNL